MVAREEGKGGMEEGPRQGAGQGPTGGCLREIPKSQVNLNENRSNFALQAHWEYQALCLSIPAL